MLNSLLLLDPKILDHEVAEHRAVLARQWGRGRRRRHHDAGTTGSTAPTTGATGTKAGAGTWAAAHLRGAGSFLSRHA